LRTTTIQSFLNNQAEYNLNRHKEFIQQQIREGKKVVFVAHGEATIYANIIYNLLTPTQKQSVSEVFIAPFAN
jgi:D-ribose pyranose/furanose isomerase RbsD